MPDKGYLLKYKFFDYSETLFYHFDVHYKLLSETITEDQRFGDYASAIQQLATPFIRIIETARQFRIVMELWDLDETQDKETVKLDDAVCYTAVRQEEHNE
ncbi:hypothetical protein FC07_GL000621 [Loigolactobacillus bifermentans DSM 20003]|uniref:Uncharacterized protein n=1 Tax=Loigolactobacillus bifermentans DSM 20003 TaxID=1423726 RepID=A0A0R1GK05_9LACO|nr:hypothetical protein FC07_GL000621 [Loigolactobacillus bifermentans DSM 20003]